MVVKNRPNATVFQMGLCRQATEVEFGSCSNACKSRRSTCLQLGELEGAVPAGFDFASTNIEGNKLDMLKAINLEKIPVEAFVTEWRKNNGDLRRKYFEKFGYMQWAKLLLFKPETGDEINYFLDLIWLHIFRELPVALNNTVALFTFFIDNLNVCP